MINSKLHTITSAFAEACKKIYGSRLESIILFGSCARGDDEPDSDMDLLVLLNVPHEEAAKVQWDLLRISNKLSLKYDVVLSPVVQSYQTFTEYLSASGFFQSVVKEGVKIA